MNKITEGYFAAHVMLNSVWYTYIWCTNYWYLVYVPCILSNLNNIYQMATIHIWYNLSFNIPLLRYHFYMMTSSNGNIFCVTGPLSPVNSPHKGQWRGALVFSSICAWINVWVNSGEVGDMRRHRAHCDVIIMWNTNNTSEICSKNTLKTSLKVHKG